MILDEIEIDIWLPDQIYMPPRGWRSAINRVAMLRATIEEHMGTRPRWEWKAILRGQCRKLAGADCREARAVVLGLPHRRGSTFMSGSPLAVVLPNRGNVEAEVL